MIINIKNGKDEITFRPENNHESFQIGILYARSKAQGIYFNIEFKLDDNKFSSISALTVTKTELMTLLSGF